MVFGKTYDFNLASAKNRMMWIWEYSQKIAKCYDTEFGSSYDKYLDGYKIAMALFKQDETKSASMARKNKMAGLDDEYRSTLLESGIKMR